MKILPAIHTSPETAYIIEDYPYGFRMRCVLRVWIEEKKNKGFRVVSQTTNPKASGTVWNAPKASTYSDLARVLYLDEEGHLQNSGLGFYRDSKEMREFLEKFEGGVYGEENVRKMLPAIEAREKIMKNAVWTITPSEPVRLV